MQSDWTWHLPGLAVVLALWLVFCGPCDVLASDCTIQGNIRFVTYNADYTVKFVSSFPDIELVRTSFPKRCGEVKVVTSGPAIRLKIVDSFPDYKVRWKRGK